MVVALLLGGVSISVTIGEILVTTRIKSFIIYIIVGFVFMGVSMVPVEGREGPFGLVRVEKGKASLDHEEFSTAKLVQEGQQLVLTQGSEVVLKFLGGKSELKLTGPLSLVLERVALESKAKKVARNEVRLSKDTLRANRSAGGVTRTALGYLDPQLPPRQVFTGNNVFELVFATSPSVLKNWYCKVEILDPRVSDELAIFSQLYHNSLTNPVFRTSSFVPGQDYQLRVTILNPSDEGGPGSEFATYTTTFRFLSLAEESVLKEFRERGPLSGKEVDRLEALVELAELYGSLGQFQSALPVWEQVNTMTSTLKRYPQLEKDLHDNLFDLSRSVRMPLPPSTF